MAKVKREVRRFENIEVKNKGLRARLDGEDERISIDKPSSERAYLYYSRNSLDIGSDELENLISLLQKLKEEMEK